MNSIDQNQILSTLEQVLTEAEVMKFLGVTRSQLDSMREKGMPFIKVNLRSRLYSVPHLLGYLETRIVRMNQG